MANAANAAQSAVTGALTKAGDDKTFRGKKSTDISEALSVYKAQIAQALPRANPDLTATRIIQIASTIVARDPKLLACDKGSIVAAVMQASILGLNPTPSLAECYFIPYGGVCTFQIGYRGFVTQYHRCKLVKEVYAYPVLDTDVFSYKLGLEPSVTHEPGPDSAAANGSNLTHVYAVAHYHNGGKAFVVLTKADVERLRRRGGNGPSWTTDYAAMAMAKALKQLKRYIPADGALDVLESDEKVLRLEHFRTDGQGVDAAKLEDIPEADYTVEDEAPADAPAEDATKAQAASVRQHEQAAASTEPAKRRGRPPGSTNKPKPAEEVPPPEDADRPATRTSSPTLDRLKAEASSAPSQVMTDDEKAALEELEPAEDWDEGDEEAPAGDVTE
jgi:recombination protein RecT